MKENTVKTNEEIQINDINLVDEGARTFRNRFETICERRKQWDQTVFSTANKGLYEILADLYKLYEQMDEKDETTERIRAWLVNEAIRQDIPFKQKKPSLIDLLVKVAFTSTVKDSKRVSAYARVLKVIANTEGVYAADIPKWIETQGGIEEIRQQTAKSTATKTERFEKGKEIVIEAETLASITIDAASAFVSGNVNKPVVLVGILNASGVIDIKHICVEKDDESKISGKSAINSALANVYSKHNDKQKKNEAKEKAEESADKNSDHVKKVLEMIKQRKEKNMTLAA